MTTTYERGNQTEGVVLGAYLAVGFRVSIPFGTGCPYDLIVDPCDGLPLVKVQAKTGWIDDGAITYNARRKAGSTWKCNRRFQREEADYFVIYVPTINELFAVPAEEQRTGGRLRVEQSRNNQVKGIRWAADYRFDEHIRQLRERGNAPGTTRTCDLIVRSDALYPAELRVQQDDYSQEEIYPQIDKWAESAQGNMEHQWSTTQFDFRGAIMRAAKRKRLEDAGWQVGSADEFLGLSNAEAAIVEMKLALADKIKALREKHHLSQSALAERIGSSQSRIAKIEAGDPSVTLDLLVRTTLAAGATKKDVAKALTATE